MKDSKGNKISIGDRVKVLWNFDNKIHDGGITNISNEFGNYSAQSKYRPKHSVFSVNTKN